MTALERYDILIFGGGKAGKTLAMDLAKTGKSVAMVEAGMIGGSCINVACIPSKTFIRSAEIAHSMKNPEEFGARIDRHTTSLEAVRSRTARVVAEMVATNQAGFDASGMELIIGWGKFIGPKALEVETKDGTRRLTGNKVFINLGTVADIPNIPGLAEARPITHVEALQLDKLPSHLIVIGGGYIGMELGQAFRRFGSDVTILDRGPVLAPREDQDVSDAVRKVLEDEGIRISLGVDIVSVSGRSGDSVKVTMNDGSSVEGSHLLVASGRRPRTSNIGLDLAGVELDSRGFIKVDDELRTSASDIWALGEVAGTPMFTHASLDDYRVVKSSLNGGPRKTTDRLIPYCVFIDPEFARVGLNETEAQRLGISYRLAKLPMSVVPRARTLSKRQGFMKALVAADTDSILGFSMLGVTAGEVMSVVQMAILGQLPYTSLRDGIIAHPTIAEGLNMLFASLSAPH